MHGCGNDYIFFDPIKLSDRHKGIGGDGIVLILPSEVADARMLMYNADGTEGSMCGNAIRCVAKYLGKDDVRIETKSGIKHITRSGETFRVDMGAPKFLDGGIISMGNPHKVIFCDDVDKAELGAHLGNDVNTEFVQVVDWNYLKMRVWERGSGETLACGTGACASAVAAVVAGYCDRNVDIIVELSGGTLVINYTDETVYMTGGCNCVFNGRYNENQ